MKIIYEKIVKLSNEELDFFGKKYVRHKENDLHCIHKTFEAYLLWEALWANKESTCKTKEWYE